MHNWCQILRKKVIMKKEGMLMRKKTDLRSSFFVYLWYYRL